MANHEDELDTPPTVPVPPLVEEKVKPGEEEAHPHPEPEPVSMEVDAVDFTSPKEAPAISVSREETRAKIALLFTQLFLFLIFLALIGPFFIYLTGSEAFSNPTDIAKNLVTIIASVLAGPFGFIVGFYFKRGGED